MAWGYAGIYRADAAWYLTIIVRSRESGDGAGEGLQRRERLAVQEEAYSAGEGLRRRRRLTVQGKGLPRREKLAALGKGLRRCRQTESERL